MLRIFHLDYIPLAFVKEAEPRKPSGDSSRRPQKLPRLRGGNNLPRDLYKSLSVSA